MAATLSNWRTAPHNVWAFRNVNELVPTESIAKGAKTIELPQGQQLSMDSIRVGTRSIEDFHELTHTDGFLLLHKGKIINEYYSNGNDASTKHIIFSMTKSMTGLITGVLHSQGHVDLSAEVKKYVPEVSPIYDGVTVQQLLDMQSGIKYDDNQHEYRGASAWEPLDGSEPFKTLHEFLQGVKADIDPQKGFNYSSVNTDLLGWVLERATGRKLSELLSELLWEKVGAESEASITVDSEGSARAAGGMSATVRDLARIGQLLIDGGRDVVPKTWLDEMLHGGNAEKFANGQWAGAFRSGFGKPAYHDCWVTDPEVKVVLAMGIFGQMLIVDSEHELVMVKTSSQVTGAEFDKSVLAFHFFAEIRKALAGQI